MVLVVVVVAVRFWRALVLLLCWSDVRGSGLKVSKVEYDSVLGSWLLNNAPGLTKHGFKMVSTGSLGG